MIRILSNLCLGAVFMAFLPACSFTTPAMTQQSTDKLLSRFDAQDETQVELTARLEDMLLSQQQLTEQLFVLKNEVGEIDQTLKRVSASQKAYSARTQSVEKLVPPAALKVKPTNLQKTLLGRVEWLWFDKVQHFLKAQVDTGILSSVIYAQEIMEFERDGDKWMRFNIQVEHNDDTVTQSIEAPVAKIVKSKNASKKDSEKRIRVSLLVRIADVAEEQEFTLIEKKSYNYPIVLGRNFLTDIALVDVAQKFIHKRDAKLEKKAKGKYDPLVVKSKGKSKTNSKSSVVQKKS